MNPLSWLALGPAATRVGPWLVVLAAIAFVGAVRIRLLDLPLERDEGEYAYAGQLILQGIPPYQLAYTAKLPGTHLMYALSLAAFGESAAAIRLGLLLVNAVSVVLIFLVGRHLLDAWAGAGAAVSFALLSLSGQVLGLAAHATHFVVLFASGALVVVIKAQDNRRGLILFAAGLLFGLALLMKQHGALLGLFGLVWVLRREWPWSDWRATLMHVTVYLAGWALPLGLVCGWLGWVGVWDSFWFWTVRYASHYARLITPSDGLYMLTGSLPRVTHGALWYWGLAGAGLVLLCRPRVPQQTRLFLIGLSLSSVAAVRLGMIFRDQYFILLLPAIALLTGMTLKWLHTMVAGRGHRKLATIVPVLLVVLGAGHLTWSQRAPWFRLVPIGACRWIYGVNPFPETRAFGLYLQKHAAPGAQIAVLGSEPQVYFYARRRSATGYLYMYPLAERQPWAGQMAADLIRRLESSPPEYLVLVFTPASWGIVPNLEMPFIRWISEFSRQHYQLIGVADHEPPPPTRSHHGKEGPGLTVVWGSEAAAAYLAQADPEAALPVMLLRRK